MVELLLSTAVSDDSVLGLGCGDQSLGLAALNALFEILSAEASGFTFGYGDAGHERGGMAGGGFHFDLRCDAVGGIGSART